MRSAQQSIGWLVVVGVAAGIVGSRPAAAQELKVGYIQVEKLVGNYQRTKASEAELEKQGKQKEAELQARVNELKKLRESLELLNDQSKEAKGRELEQKSDELQRFRTNTGRDLARERQQILGEILKDVRQAVDEYAKANGFSLVMRDDALLYALPAIDITDPVLKALNGRYAAPADPAKAR